VFYRAIEIAIVSIEGLMAAQWLKKELVAVVGN
jgi:hypothetical protein